MNDDLHNIDDLFKKALEDHTDLPSTSVWDNIDKSLDKNKVVSISKKYNKLKWAAAILLLFSFGMAMYSYYIGIKNKELVKQNNDRNNTQNHGTQLKEILHDSLKIVKRYDGEQHKVKVKEALKNQENNTSEIIAENKIEQTGDNAINNVKHENASAPGKALRSSPAPQTRKYITQQEQEKTLPKSISEIKNNDKSVATISNYNREKSTEISIVAGSQQAPSMNNESHQKSNDNDDKIVLAQRNYIAEIPTVSELKDMFQLLVVKPFTQIFEVIENNNVVLNTHPVPLNKSNTKTPGYTPFSAILFFSPELVSTDLKNDHPRFREDDRHEIEKDENISFSSTLGMLLNYNLNKKWALETGFTFSKRVTDIQPKTIFARPDDFGNIGYRFNCSAGYSFVNVHSPGPPALGDSAKALFSKNTLQYIGVPLAIKYRITKGKFSIVPGAGMSANFLTKGKIETTVAAPTGNESASNDIQGLRSAYFNGSASIGAEYKLNKSLALTFIPTAHFALSSINKNAPVKTNFNSIGLTGGLILRF